jgi:hypothetical protein
VRDFGHRWLCSTSVAIGGKISGVSLMPMDHSPSEQPHAAANDKKPYEKPAFRHEQVFVTTALSCGKITVSQTGCGLNTKVS